MTPKEKAIELVHRYDLLQGYVEYFGYDNAKECALIAVDEILESHYVFLTGVKPFIYEYWKEVKQEIEKL